VGHELAAGHGDKHAAGPLDHLEVHDWPLEAAGKLRGTSPEARPVEANFPDRKARKRPCRPSQCQFPSQLPHAQLLKSGKPRGSRGPQSALGATETRFRASRPSLAARSGEVRRGQRGSSGARFAPSTSPAGKSGEVIKLRFPVYSDLEAPTPRRCSASHMLDSRRRYVHYRFRTSLIILVLRSTPHVSAPGARAELPAASESSSRPPPRHDRNPRKARS
jgi:hypothetical protein